MAPTDREFGAMEERVKSLESHVESQDAEIKEMRALFNKGRGALWIIATVGGIVAFLTSQWDKIKGAI